MFFKMGRRLALFTLSGAYAKGTPSLPICLFYAQRDSPACLTRWRKEVYSRCPGGSTTTKIPIYDASFYDVF